MKNRYFWILIVALGLLVFLWILFLVPKFSLGLIQSGCDECSNYSEYDTIKIASELGRLDIVSLCLAFLGIGFGFFAIFSFLNIKDNSISAAKQEAKEFLDNHAKPIFKEFESKHEANITAMVESIVARKINESTMIGEPERVSVPAGIDTTNREEEGGQGE